MMVVVAVVGLVLWDSLVSTVLAPARRTALGKSVVMTAAVAVVAPAASARHVPGTANANNREGHVHPVVTARNVAPMDALAVVDRVNRPLNAPRRSNVWTRHANWRATGNPVDPTGAAVCAVYARKVRSAVSVVFARTTPTTQDLVQTEARATEMAPMLEVFFLQTVRALMAMS